MIQGRIYYRNKLSGDMGYLVETGDTKMVRIDDDLRVVPFSAQWEKARDERKLTEHQVAQIAFEADKKLCFHLGLHKLAKRQWVDLEQTVRASWMSGKRRFEDVDRQVLYSSVFEAMKDLLA